MFSHFEAVASIWFNCNYREPMIQTIQEVTTMEADTPAAPGPVRVDEEKLRGHADEVAEALWDTGVNSGTASRLNHKIYRHIEA